MRTTHWDASKKLLRHIYDDEKKFWNDSSHWGGGNGWNVAAMAQLIELLPNEMIAEKQKVIAGWLDKKYLVLADKMRAASYTKIDKFGLIHDASSSPGFNRPGTSTGCQAFFLLMEGAYLKLNK